MYICIYTYETSFYLNYMTFLAGLILLEKGTISCVLKSNILIFLSILLLLYR